MCLRVKILLVEDNADIQRAMVLLLTRSGYEVIEAGTVTEGIDRFDDQPVILLDLYLPDGSGMEVLKFIREGKTCPRIAILTAPFEIKFPREIDHGVDAIFRKPIDFQQILNWIGRFSH